MNIEELVQIKSYNGKGFKPLINYGGWRVAILRFIDSLKPENIDFFECHNETDEVFVLLEGKCLLFIQDPEDNRPSNIHAVYMEPLKLYNIRKGAFHSHALSPNASVLIIENENTNAENSTQNALTKQQKDQIISLSEDILLQ